MCIYLVHGLHECVCTTACVWMSDKQLVGAISTCPVGLTQIFRLAQLSYLLAYPIMMFLCLYIIYFDHIHPHYPIWSLYHSIDFIVLTSWSFCFCVGSCMHIYM